jgi:hypothetical protein
MFWVIFVHLHLLYNSYQVLNELSFRNLFNAFFPRLYSQELVSSGDLYLSLSAPAAWPKLLP